MIKQKESKFPTDKLHFHTNRNKTMELIARGRQIPINVQKLDWKFAFDWRYQVVA